MIDTQQRLSFHGFQDKSSNFSTWWARHFMTWPFHPLLLTPFPRWAQLLWVPFSHAASAPGNSPLSHGFNLNVPNEKCCASITIAFISFNANPTLFLWFLLFFQNLAHRLCLPGNSPWTMRLYLVSVPLTPGDGLSSLKQKLYSTHLCVPRAKQRPKVHMLVEVMHERTFFPFNGRLYRQWS